MNQNAPRYRKLRLAASAVCGLFGLLGIVLVGVAREVAMNSEATYLSLDYTTIGWALRILGILLGQVAMLGALWARPVTRQRPIGKWWYRLVLAIACCGIAYEIAVPVISVVVFAGVAAFAYSGSKGGEDGGDDGCLMVVFSVFDFDD